jgi:hypothetical protein
MRREARPVAGDRGFTLAFRMMRPGTTLTLQDSTPSGTRIGPPSAPGERSPARGTIGARLGSVWHVQASQVPVKAPAGTSAAGLRMGPLLDRVTPGTDESAQGLTRPNSTAIIGLLDRWQRKRLRKGDNRGHCRHAEAALGGIRCLWL